MPGKNPSFGEIIGGIPEPEWMDKPQDHDYEAADDYLSLLMAAHDAARHSNGLRRNGVKVKRKAKDILRASGELLLPATDLHVAADLTKIKEGKPLSPILLIRGQLGVHPLLIADGKHRVCAVYYRDVNAEVSCVIA